MWKFLWMLLAVVPVFLISSVAWSGNESSAAYEQNEGYHKAEYGEKRDEIHHGHNGLKCDCGNEQKHCRGHKDDCKAHKGDCKAHKGFRCDCLKHGHKKHQHHHDSADGDLEDLFN